MGDSLDHLMFVNCSARYIYETGITFLFFYHWFLSFLSCASDPRFAVWPTRVNFMVCVILSPVQQGLMKEDVGLSLYICASLYSTNLSFIIGKRVIYAYQWSIHTFVKIHPIRHQVKFLHLTHQIKVRLIMMNFFLLSFSQLNICWCAIAVL